MINPQSHAWLTEATDRQKLDYLIEQTTKIRQLLETEHVDASRLVADVVAACEKIDQPLNDDQAAVLAGTVFATVHPLDSLVPKSKRL